MLYLAHALQPTSVRHALKCDFLSPGVDCLVLGKHSAIEVHAIQPDGIHLLHQRLVFGVIEHLQAYKKPLSPTATLLVLTSDLNVFTLRFCQESQTIYTSASLSLNQIGARPADYVQTSVVDPHGRCVVLHALNGILHVIPLRPGCRAKPENLANLGFGKRKKSNASTLDLLQPAPSEGDLAAKEQVELYQAFQIRLNEVNVHALEFAALSEDHPPILLVVYSNHLGDRVLRSRQIDLLGAHCEQDFCPTYKCDDPATGLIIPISNDPDQRPYLDEDVGALLIGEESAELARYADYHVQGQTGSRKGKSRTGPRPVMDSKRKKIHDYTREMIIGPEAKLPLGSYTCHCKIEDQQDSWLVGDLYGSLLVLHLQRSQSGEPVKLVYEHIGHIPSPEALVYISNGFVFLASHYGDSQLLKITSTFFEAQYELTPSPPEVIHTFPNVAPVSDFCVVGDQMGNDVHLVSCSGAYRDGSLRIIKHGVGISNTGIIEISDVRRIWALKSSSLVLGANDYDDSLILSFLDRTRFLSFDEEGSMEEMEQFNGFRADLPTILAGNLLDASCPETRYALQVTPEALIAGQSVFWKPVDGGKISVAAKGESLLAVSLKREVLLLNLKDNSVQEAGKLDFLNDVSSLAIDQAQQLVAVGQWVTNSVYIYSIGARTTVYQVETRSEFVVSSLMIMNFEGAAKGAPRLLVGLGDGKAMNLEIDAEGQVLSDTLNLKAVSFGMRPIEFIQIGNADQGRKVFVNTDRPSLISPVGPTRRFRYSGISTGGGSIVSACWLNSKNFPGFVVLAFKDGMRIGRVDETKKMEIVKIPLGSEQPRRIAHSKAMRAYGVVCVRVELDQGTGELRRIGSVKILDDETFQLLYDFKLLSNEQGSSIAVVELGEEPLEYFVVGTGLVRPNESEASSGQILGIRDVNAGQADQPGEWVGRKFRLTNMTRVTGSVGGIGALPGGKLVASANAFVHVFGIADNDGADREVESTEDKVGGFKLIDTWGGGFVSQTVVTEGTTVLVGDLYKSIVLLEFDPSNSELFVKARDYNSMSVRPIGRISEREFIGADSDFNLFTVERRLDDLENKQEKELLLQDMQVDRVEEEEEKEKNLWDEDEMSVEKRFHDDNLTHVGAFHLGENVNHFRSGSLIPRYVEDHLPARTQIIFATSTGGIGIIAPVKDEVQALKLMRLESKMRNTVKSLGNLDPAKYRMFKTKAKTVLPTNFVDGNFIQSFMDLPPKQAEEVMKSSNWVHQDQSGSVEASGSSRNLTHCTEATSYCPGQLRQSDEATCPQRETDSSVAQLEEVMELLEELSRLH